MSRRTFSNYFANKEEALLYGDHQRIAVLIGMVQARPAGEGPWEALTAAAREFYREVGLLDAAWLAQTRLLRTQPALLAQQVTTFAAVERELAAAVTARATEPDPAGVRARLAAATFLASLRVALHIWLDNPADTSLADLVDRALAEAGRGFA